jgi:hypothetical protein
MKVFVKRVRRRIFECDTVTATWCVYEQCSDLSVDASYKCITRFVCMNWPAVWLHFFLLHWHSDWDSRCHIWKCASGFTMQCFGNVFLHTLYIFSLSPVFLMFEQSLPHVFLWWFNFVNPSNLQYNLQPFLTQKISTPWFLLLFWVFQWWENRDNIVLKSKKITRTNLWR